MFMNGTTRRSFSAMPFASISFAPYSATEKARIDELLRLISLSMGGLVLLSAISTLLLTSNRGVDFLFYGMMIGVLGIMEGLRRGGHLRIAAVFFCTALWLVIMLFNLSSSSYSPFFIPILCASLLLGARAGVLFTVLSITFGLAVVLSGRVPGATLENWLLLSMIFVGVMTLLWLNSRHTRLAYQDARKFAEQAAAMNRFLYDEIAHQVRTENALRESEARYRQLLDHSPVAMAVTDIHNFALLYLNQACAALMGFPEPAALIGQSYLDMIADESQHALEQQRQQILGGVPSLTVEATLRRESGEIFTAEITSIPILYQEVQAALSIVTDITERNRLQQERLHNEVMRAELEKEKQYVTLRQNFVTMASHQFRTPLSVILSSRDLLELYFDRMTPEKRREHLDKISLHARIMVELLDDILTISKASARMLEARPQPMPLEQFCRQYVDDYAQHHPSHQYTFAGSLPGSYLLDERLTRHALNNLLSNATKYSPDGSAIDIRLEARTLPNTDHPWAVLSVRDHGIGIPPEEHPQLFETFYRASNAQYVSGTGLGLTIAKICIEAQGGQLSFTSALGEGTTFIITLPLQTQAAQPLQPTQDRPITI